MLGLGHWVMVPPRNGTVETRLDNEKTERWSLDLKEDMRTGRCSALLASKFAGRFSCAVTVQNNKVGRANIR